MTERFANEPSTTLNGTITSGATSLVVTSASGFPAANFRVRIDDEYMLVTAVAGTTWTVTRAMEGSSAAAHSSGAAVAHVLTAGGLAQALSEVVVGLPLTINSNYDHFQRGVGARTCPTTFDVNTSFSADRMFTLPAGASVTTARSTSVPGTKSQASVLITGAASVTTVDHGQRIRAAIVATRGRQSLVFSASIFNNTGAAFTPNLRVGTPGAADTFTTVTNRLDQALSSCPDGVWTQLSYVFDPTAYTNIANGMEVVLRVPTGVLVATKTINVAQFDVRPGSVFASYPPPDPSAALWDCLEYCWQQTSEFVGLAAGSTLLDGGVYVFPRPMRRVATVVTGSYGVNAGSAGTFRAQQIGTRSAFLDNSAANWTTSAIVTATATWEAELS